MKIFFRLITIIYFISNSFSSYSQVIVDTIRSQNPEQADTIVIYEEPVIISSQVKVYRPPVKTKKNTLFFSLDGGINYNFDYNDVCPECIDYYNKVKSATKKLPGYTYSVQLSYSKGNWITGLSIGSYNQRSKFKYSDSTGSHTSINKLQTIDGKISIGYWIGKNNNKKISFIPSLLFTISTPYNISGQLYTQDTTKTTDQLKNALDFHSILYIGGVETKVLYQMKKNFYFTITPSYNYDLSSILSKVGPFSLQRHIFALKIGVMLALK